MLPILTAATADIQPTDHANPITQPNTVSSPRPATSTGYNLNTDAKSYFNPH